MEVGESYTLLFADQSSDNSIYFLVEFLFLGFNSLMFMSIKWEETCEGV